MIPAKFSRTRFLLDNCTIVEEIILFDSKERDRSIDRVYRRFTELKFERKIKQQSRDREF